MTDGEALSSGGAPMPASAAAREDRGGRAAALVGAGILLSRILGLVRQRVFAHYFGVVSDPADAFSAAFRIPNFLQNLFGEGVLSASFIPVYSRRLADGDEEEAGRIAGAVLAVLALTISVIVLAGVLFTPLFVDVIAQGFEGAKRELTIRLVRVLFPGAGLLVLSAWCLGILNSHRRFFLSYAAPVLWNVAMIATLLGFGGGVGQARLAELLAWGSVVGSALQFGVQLPSVLRLVRRLRVRIDTASAHVREVLRNFVPVFIGRGVVQISAFIDTIIASGLPTGAVTGITFAQTLYTLPVSLFGMAVSAAELPAMSSLRGSESEVAAVLRSRLEAGLRRIAFFIVPSTVAFVAIGDALTSLLFRTGRFEVASVFYVWGILAGSAVGLLASTFGRLYSSTFYAMRDTRTPLRYALVRVALTMALGVVAAFQGPRLLGIDARWGAAGLTLASSIAGWVEYALLRRALGARIGGTRVGASYALRLAMAGLLAAALAWGTKILLGGAIATVDALLVIATFGASYLGVAALLVPETRALATGVLGRLGVRRRR